MGVATRHDLEAILDFMVEYAYDMKQDTGVVPYPQRSQDDVDRTKAEIRQRYRDAIGAIMDCSIRGRMTGIVVLIEYDGQIKGVAAANIVSLGFDDPWSRNERRVYSSGDSRWVFPGYAYMNLLREVMTHRSNGNRPVLSVPYFMFSLERYFLMPCLQGLSKFIKKLGREFKHSTIVNTYCGNAYTEISPSLDIFLQYPVGSAIKDDTTDPRQNCHPYVLRAKFMPRVRHSPPPARYLDESVQGALRLM
ncbi:hypothetical protein O1611_g5391 [Lasiodiplodia mahajangana]|uniref:Uncharacterized protein n=1 Tax=Lasiodiplodia mahajangana TaxID=1108764 RepID=A0ACC2JLL3_9PEZI|nr:hypothetical protein O1611_g5391 [Lasiodiplodia mahajangana]